MTRLGPTRARIIKNYYTIYAQFTNLASWMAIQRARIWKPSDYRKIALWPVWTSKKPQFYNTKKIKISNLRSL